MWIEIGLGSLLISTIWCKYKNYKENNCHELEIKVHFCVNRRPTQTLIHYKNLSEKEFQQLHDKWCLEAQHIKWKTWCQQNQIQCLQILDSCTREVLDEFYYLQKGENQ